MGTRNRQRRAEKRRRHERASAPRGGRRVEDFPTRELIYAAAAAAQRASAGDATYRDLVAALAAGPSRVAAELDVVLGEALRQARGRNWDPTELGRQAVRRMGERGAGYMADVVAGASGPTLVDRWAARAGLGRYDAVAEAIAVIALLLGLPPLPRLGPASGSGPAARPRASAQNVRMLERVRALLAKAESTTFPEEAEALSSKAQELMARHAIDEAMVGAGTGAGAAAGESPTGVHVPVDDPYAGAKSILLSVVASANRCRAVWSKDHGFSTVMGFDADLEFVQLLYTSLLVQATSAMVAAGPHVDRSGRSRTRSFRQAFLLAYATRIGHRLRAAEAASRAAAAEEYGEALLPVLANRTAAVEEASAAAFPDAVSRSVSVSNAAGWAAGAAAADMASLSGRTEVPA
ncbi:MAG: DUF2786 domain-containing protein [Acidimicrobiales bacterium]